MRGKLFTNATLLGDDGRFTRGEIVVEDRTIVRVGPVGELPAGIQRIDLGGRCVVAGFVDAHFHLLALSLKPLRCDLSGTASARDVVEKMKTWAAAAEPALPIVGVEWDQSSWKDRAFPTRTMLDEVDATRPVFARRICCHVGVVNSAFLSLLDAPADFIDRETGLVTEAAVAKATEMSYPPGDAIIPSVEAAISELHALGVTGIHDVVGMPNLESYLEGIRRSRLPLRVDALMHVAPGEYAGVAERSRDLGGALFRPFGIKVFSDGSIGGHTAALNSPYADARTLGEYLLEDGELEKTLRWCCDDGVTCAVHAIGDRALQAVLHDMMKFPSDRELFRIEHAELTGWDEIRLLEKMPVDLVMQPNFVRVWQQRGGLYEERLGRDRWRACNRFATLDKIGIRYAFGSDGMPPGPLFGVKGATHHPVEGERIGLGDALVKYTGKAGLPVGEKSGARGLGAGNTADFVVLGGDPSLGDPDALRVEETYVSGKKVYPRL